jgi:hypothetical protein
MNNELSRFNRVRYTFYSDILDPLVIEEPANWNDDEKEIIRSDKWFGITKNLSNNLEYYGNAFDYIKSVYDISGIKGNVRLEKEERDGQSDRWELSYSGYLDFTTYKQDKNYIKIKFNESQFFKNIESRMKEKYELERLDDLKGNPIPPLAYKTLSLQGRDIFRETFFNNQDETLKIKYKGSSTWDALYDVVLPLNLIYRSDESFFAPSVNILAGGFLDLPTAQISRGSGGSPVFYSPGGLYYLVADQDRTIDIQVRLKFRAKFASPENGDDATFRIYHDTVRKIGNDYESVQEDLIMQCVGASSAPDTPPTYYTIEYDTWKSFDITYETTMDLLEGDSLGLRIQPFFFPNPYNRTNVWDFEFETIEVLGQENDLGETTTCDALKMYDVLDRLFLIITGKQCFQSSLLSNEWRDLLMSNGFKIRKFTDKNITISLEEALNCLMAIDDIALLIQNNTVRVEKKREAFIPEVIIDVGEVSDIEREIVEKEHFSSIEIGYDFDGKYEEVNGLDEYNIKNTYSTCIDTTDNTLKAISKVRADAYGITLAQLKPFQDFPKLDTPYDKENFLFDAKLVSGNNYELRHWEDDFDSAPTGIFSPQTAFNLRLSPFNSLLRKGKTISCGLQKFPTELLKYASTEGNSQLVTLYPERAQIQNNVLAVPYFLPEKITFEKKITLQQFKLIVDSPYKLIKFVNEFGDEEFGYICPGSQGIKPNKEGKFTLIKANY